MKNFMVFAGFCLFLLTACGDDNAQKNEGQPPKPVSIITVQPQKIAAVQAEEALAVYEQTIRAAGLDVENSLSALQSSLGRQQSLEKSVKSSQRSFAQAETLYQQGLISFLDVVDAQRQSASAEQSLAREKTNYATQIATLFNALGVTKE